MNTPVSVVRAALDAIESQDWVAAARLCDPASLSMFKRELLALVDPTSEAGQALAERLRRMRPEFSGEAAEPDAAPFSRFLDPESGLSDQVAGVGNVAELRSMTPLEVFAAHLAANTLERVIERARRYEDVSPEVAERALREHMPMTRCTVLGSVADGDDFAWVVYVRQPGGAGPQAEDPDPDDLWTDLTHEERRFRKDALRPFPWFAICRRQPDGQWLLIADRLFIGHGNFAVSFRTADEDDAAPA